MQIFMFFKKELEQIKLLKILLLIIIFSLGNFFPSSLGISFPITTNYNIINNSPKYFPGTDIRTNGSAPDSVMVKSSTINITGKISKKVKSENPFIKIFNR